MCHSRHHHAARGEHAAPAPLVEDPHDLRTSDAERERVVEALRTHAGEGRLDADELEERLERAYAARTRADLVPLLADLPPAPPRRHDTSGAGDGLRSFLMINALLIAIWALTGGGYFWPIWPLIGTGFCLVASSFQAPPRQRQIVTR
jgi:Domain of unknown function (DUF1707)